jgi:hypothetical protein
MGRRRFFTIKYPRYRYPKDHGQAKITIIENIIKDNPDTTLVCGSSRRKPLVRIFMPSGWSFEYYDGLFE